MGPVPDRSDWRSAFRLERLGTMSGYASGQPDLQCEMVLIRPDAPAARGTDSVARECGPKLITQESKTMTNPTRYLLDDQPTPFSHYCHGVQSGNQLWISGTVGITADGHVPGDVVEQFAIAMRHLDGVLRAAGGGPRHIVESADISHRHRGSRADQSAARALLRRASARIDPGRGLRTGRSADEGRDRSGGGDRLTFDQRKRPFASA